MTGGGIIEHGSFAPRGSPGDVWKTNDGIYLGRTVYGGTDQDRPLNGIERLSLVGTEYDIRSRWTPDGGNFLYTGEGHINMVAPPRSGKTRKFLMPNLVGLLDWSCVVIDPKGENCAHTAVWRAASHNHTVIVFDPFEVMKTNYKKLYDRFPHILKSRGFNPVRSLKLGDNFVDDAKYLAEALITTEGTKDIHFPQGAQALIKGLLMALRVDKPGHSDSLAKLRDILGLPPKQLASVINVFMTQHGKQWPAIAASLGEFSNYSAEDKEIAGIRRTAKIQMDWLDSPPIRRNLEQKEAFSFAELKQKPTTIYIIVPPERLESHRVFLRLMITSVLMPLLNTVERSPVPVLFMLDEFAHLGHMPIIKNNIAQMGGFGIKLWTIWQYLSQAKDLYGEGFEAFIATAGANVIFATRDATTPEYFSKLSGEKLFRHQTQSKQVSKSNGENWGSAYSSGWSSTSGTNSGASYSAEHNTTAPGHNSGHSVSSGKSTNKSDSSGGSWQISEGETSGEQLINERRVRNIEFAALDVDEAVIFARGGRILRTICPQPEALENEGVADPISMAREWIETESEYPAPRLLSHEGDETDSAPR